MGRKLMATLLIMVMAVMLFSGCAKTQSGDANATDTPKETETPKATETPKETVKEEAPKDAWPTETLTIICPWAVGGLADQVNRAMSEYGKAQFGVDLLADNLLGAGGAVALTQYLQEKPNSSNLIFASEGNFTIDPLVSDIDYSFEDFTPIIQIYSSTMILSANPSTGVDSFEKFEDYVASNVVKIATNGYTSSEALQGAGLVTEMGGELQIVAYEGANEALNAAVSGEVDFAITHGSLAKEFVKSGGILPVVAFDNKKLINEVYNLDCVEDYGYDTWITNICVLYTKAGTDQANVDKLYNGFLNILQDPAFLETAANIGLNIDPKNGEEVAAYIESCKAKAEKYASYLN